MRILPFHHIHQPWNILREKVQYFIRVQYEVQSHDRREDSDVKDGGRGPYRSKNVLQYVTVQRMIDEKKSNEVKDGGRGPQQSKNALNCIV